MSRKQKLQQIKKLYDETKYQIELIGKLEENRKFQIVKMDLEREAFFGKIGAILYKK